MWNVFVLLLRKWESKRIGVWELGRYCQVFVLNNGLWKVLVLDGKIMWKWNEGN